MRAWRVALVVAGVGAAGYGAFLLFTEQRLDQVLAVVIWLAGAIVLHDAIIAPATAVVGGGLRRAGGRMPRGAVTLVEAGLVIGGLFGVIVLPLLIAQARGPRNPTILAGDYALAFALLWLVIVVLVAVGVAALRARRRTRA
ncbi:hypothetical protein [Agromyces sp. SYSU T00194]|uniref:hypothetical protein n=1 Tax=Agromyces chitinivorans TaxID=3158560 RepID=UPI0033913A98